MLNEYLSLNHIQLAELVTDWRHAIKLVAQPLIQTCAIKSIYVERILQLTQEIGPYYVIAPQIAMPHSRPEDGVLQQALSLLVLKQGVNFGSDNDPVRLILMLAATDNTSHLEMLAAVADLLGDETTVQAILQADNISDIATIIARY